MASKGMQRGFAPLRQQLRREQGTHQSHLRHFAYTTTTPPQQRASSPLSQKRLYSTPPPPSSSSTNVQPPQFSDLRSQLNGSTPSPPPPPPQAKQRKSFRTIIYASTFFLIGLTAGQYASSLLAPVALPVPLSDEDMHHTSILRQAAHAIPLALHLAKDPAWESWDAYTSHTPETLPNRLTSGPLAGYRGIGHQRVFANKETGEFVVLVWIGKALAGWPGATHGGAIATVLDECLARPAMRQFEGGVVTGRLEIQYLKPVVTGGWWVIRSRLEEMGQGGRKAWVAGTLEDLEGNVHVKSRALYVVPKTVKLKGFQGKF